MTKKTRRRIDADLTARIALEELGRKRRLSTLRGGTWWGVPVRFTYGRSSFRIRRREPLTLASDESRARRTSGRLSGCTPRSVSPRLSFSAEVRKMGAPEPQGDARPRQRSAVGSAAMRGPLGGALGASAARTPRPMKTTRRRCADSTSCSAPWPFSQFAPDDGDAAG
jgi:hypothetical protein